MLLDIQSLPSTPLERGAQDEALEQKKMVDGEKKKLCPKSERLVNKQYLFCEFLKSPIKIRGHRVKYTRFFNKINLRSC